MPRTKREDVFPNYIRVKDTDKEALAELVIKAKGNRSLSEFARACGVNPSTLSRLVNQKNLGPCADTLIKSIADNAAPDSGVTLGMLLEAHGLAEVVVGESQRFAGLETIMKQFVSTLQDNSKAVGTVNAIFRDLYLHSTYDDGIAVSLVLSDEQAFETIRQKYCGAEIYDYVSMILVDRMKRCVLDEFIFLRKGKEQRESVLVEREL